VTLTIRKIEQEILASGGSVCILTTRSGDDANTHALTAGLSPDAHDDDDDHPDSICNSVGNSVGNRHSRRQILFLDNSVPIPFLFDPDNPTTQYHLGFSLSPSVRSHLDAFNPTVVHITVPDCTGLHVVDYARTRHLPLVGTFHSNIADYMDHYPGMSWLQPIIHAFFRHQYNFLQALYVPTPFMRQKLVDEERMDRITELRIWGRGVDTDRFGPRHRSLEWRRRLGIDDDEVVLLFVGRLVPEKRPDIFADVVRRLAAEKVGGEEGGEEGGGGNAGGGNAGGGNSGVRFRALVVGTGPHQDEMKALPRTTCLGWLSGPDLAVAYASSDVFLFPSSVETFGNVTLEAAASGLPLVVDGGCSGHLVEEGVNGHAVAAGDVDAYYAATRSLVVDGPRQQRLAAASRPKSLRFETSTISRQMLRNYDRVGEEFYAVHGGCHHRRDEAYVNPDSFRGGRLPRPYGLGLVEIFFITAFRIMTHFLGVYLWMQEVMVMPLILRLQRAAASANIPTGVSKKHALAAFGKDEDSSSCRPAFVIEDLKHAGARTSTLPSRTGGGSSSPTSSSGEMNSPFFPSISGTLNESFLTGTTSSSSSETSSDAAVDNCIDLEAVDASSSCARHIASFGDGPVARMLALWFVRIVLLSWRTSALISTKLGVSKMRSMSPSSSPPQQQPPQHRHRRLEAERSY